jgi:hypothetical protein
MVLAAMARSDVTVRTGGASRVRRRVAYREAAPVVRGFRDERLFRCELA